MKINLYKLFFIRTSLPGQVSVDLILKWFEFSFLFTESHKIRDGKEPSDCITFSSPLASVLSLPPAYSLVFHSAQFKILRPGRLRVQSPLGKCPTVLDMWICFQACKLKFLAALRMLQHSYTHSLFLFLASTPLGTFLCLGQRACMYCE